MRTCLLIGMVCLGLLASNVSHALNLTAQSWLVADGNGNIINGENINEVRAIASITKLVTAMVVLDTQQDLNEYIKPYTRRELIQLALVRSDNRSAQLLCELYPGGLSQCVKAMNLKMTKLGLVHTKFHDPNGLSVFNISTATELIKIIQISEHYPEIVQASKSSHIKIQVKKKWLVFNNTNPIIGKRHDFIVSKTGYIGASGGCIVMMLDTDIGRRMVVVLGSRPARLRIPEAEFIATKF